MPRALRSANENEPTLLRSLPLADNDGRPPGVDNEPENEGRPLLVPGVTGHPRAPRPAGFGDVGALLPGVIAALVGALSDKPAE